MSAWWMLLPAGLTAFFFIVVDVLFDTGSDTTLWRQISLKEMSLETIAYLCWIGLAAFASLVTWIVFGAIWLVIYMVGQ